jgi:hypothetical protein
MRLDQAKVGKICLLYDQKSEDQRGNVILQDSEAEHHGESSKTEKHVVEVLD